MVVEPVPANAVVAGVPARVLSYKGSSTQVINRWDPTCKEDVQMETKN
jgi:serine acetyltransferase